LRERAELFPESLRASLRMTTPSESFPGSQRELRSAWFLELLSESFPGSQGELRSARFLESLSESFLEWLEVPQLALGSEWSEETQSLPERGLMSRPA
jgi:hypothetical protein